jgi:hypothetical protein
VDCSLGETFAAGVAGSAIDELKGVAGGANGGFPREEGVATAILSGGPKQESRTIGVETDVAPNDEGSTLDDAAAAGAGASSVRTRLFGVAPKSADSVMATSPAIGSKRKSARRLRGMMPVDAADAKGWMVIWSETFIAIVAAGRTSFVAFAMAALGIQVEVLSDDVAASAITGVDTKVDVATRALP